MWGKGAPAERECCMLPRECCMLPPSRAPQPWRPQLNSSKLPLKVKSTLRALAGPGGEGCARTSSKVQARTMVVGIPHAWTCARWWVCRSTG